MTYMKMYLTTNLWVRLFRKKVFQLPPVKDDLKKISYGGIVSKIID